MNFKVEYLFGNDDEIENEKMIVMMMLLRH